MCNRPYGFEIYLVNVKTMRTIAQIFVAFSEKLNFDCSAEKHIRIGFNIPIQLQKDSAHQIKNM